MTDDPLILKWILRKFWKRTWISVLKSTGYCEDYKSKLYITQAVIRIVSAKKRKELKNINKGRMRLLKTQVRK